MQQESSGWGYARMTSNSKPNDLTPEKLGRILEITRGLAKPIDLESMLYQVVDAAKELLDAGVGTVWQYHASSRELEMRVAPGLVATRTPATLRLVGWSWRARASAHGP